MRPSGIKILLLHLFIAAMLLSPASAENTTPAASPAGNTISMSKTFLSKDSAEKYANTLKSEGYEVDIREVTSKNKDTFYRVSGKKDPESFKDALSPREADTDKKLSPDKSTEPGQEYPGSLAILSPRERSEFRNVNKITFLWRRVPQAVSYHVILAKDRAFTRIVHENSNVTTPSYTIQGLNYGTYFFKVGSRLSNNVQGPSSETLSIIIVPPQPSTEPLILLESGT
jgi:hypothetical protein